MSAGENSADEAEVKGHPLYGQRLGCIVGIMSDPYAFDDSETAR
jgi:hypothetical protein